MLRFVKFNAEWLTRYLDHERKMKKIGVGTRLSAGSAQVCVCQTVITCIFFRCRIASYVLCAKCGPGPASRDHRLWHCVAMQNCPAAPNFGILRARRGWPARGLMIMPCYAIFPPQVEGWCLELQALPPHAEGIMIESVQPQGNKLSFAFSLSPAAGACVFGTTTPCPFSETVPPA